MGTEPTTFRIAPNDIIKGSLYLKLIDDYKAYDKRQKEIIKRLQSENAWLKDEVEYVANGNTDAIKVFAQRRLIRDLEEKVRDLKATNQRLLERIYEFQKDIK
ncbi:hypothetical protein [uncultured Alistipes sp.]|uniref:hypothetical protein n=1 Tax=uncultured Alistipes sp. TaxID=538949 RepID=UPI00260DA0E2|nr:hypothetical protein [uncultured Alistipes sp.]